MWDGRIIRGKIVNIRPNTYEVQIPDGSQQTIFKARVEEVSFSGGASERGYIGYFVRLYAGTGLSGYAEETPMTEEDSPLSDSQSFSHFLAPLGVSTGWMVLDNRLALHGGLEYSQSALLGENDLDYEYSSLTAGVSLYFDLYYNDLYLRPQARLLLSGSVRSVSENTESPDGEEITLKNVSLQEDGVGYGLSLGKEWITARGFIYGLALSYSMDTFQIERSNTIPALNAVPVRIQYYGIEISCQTKVEMSPFSPT